MIQAIAPGFSGSPELQLIRLIRGPLIVLLGLLLADLVKLPG